jgi:hypothetical protein
MILVGIPLFGFLYISRKFVQLHQAYHKAKAIDEFHAQKHRPNYFGVSPDAE